MVAGTWDTHSRNDVVEWAVMLTQSRNGGTSVQDVGTRTQCDTPNGLVVEPPKTTLGYGSWVLLSLGPKTRR
jgi:hypothetical protein